MKLRSRMIVGLAVALAAAAAVAATAVDPNPAMNAPDEFAWKLFLEVNAPAGGTNATFETWASDTDTFKPNPKFPTAVTPLSLHPPALATDAAKAQQLAGVTIPAVPPGVADDVLEESRRNRVTFDFIVNNKLNSRSGLKAAFGKEISFPVDSIEVKANWIPVASIPAWTANRVSVADAAKVFHVNTGVDGKKYALVAMHVISKAVPNWSWATFEHEFNPNRCDILGCKDAFGAAVPVTPPRAVNAPPYGACAKTPALTAMFAKAKIDAAFSHYCLKGSQVDFTDNTGLAVRLGNSVTENGFVSSSSCITCHARAAWGADGAATSRGGFVNFAPLTGPVGPIDPHWHWSNLPTPPIQGAPGAQRIGTSADFIWAVARCAYDDSDPMNPQPSACQGG